MNPTQQTVARMHERETRWRRVVLVARVTDAIPEGSFVALFDVRGELFLQVMEHDDPAIVTAGQLAQRIKTR